MKKTLVVSLLFWASLCQTQIAQATLITSEGDRNSILELELTSNQYKIDLISTFDFNQFFIPFLSNGDASGVIPNFVNWGCFSNDNYIVCNSLNNLVVSSISGFFTLPSGYEFGDFLDARPPFFSASSIPGDFESFTDSYFVEIRAVGNQGPVPEVSEPSILGLFLIPLLLIMRRKRL